MKHPWQNMWSIVALVLLAACSGPESSTSKSEWSALQVAEFNHRATPLNAPVVIEVKGRRIAGLPRNDGQGNIWVLLNPKGEPLYKQLPEGDYSLSSAELANLVATEPTVLARLSAHVRK